MRRPSRGAALGLGLGTLPGLCLGAWAVLQNPWFLDRPGVFLLAGVLAPGLLLALLGARLSRAPLGREGLLLLAPAHLLLLVLAMPTPAPDPVKMLVVGLDGATFELIDPMIADGELPGLAALSAGGARATLMSMEPMFSPLLWTTMATGKPPEQHGVRGFRTRAADLRVPRLWDIAEAEGMGVGVYKWLVSYPPRPVRGFMVPAWLAPGPETYPASLSFIKELELANRLKRRKVAARRPGWRLALAGIPQGLRLSTLLEALRWKLRERLERPDDDARFHALQLLRLRMDRDVFVHALHRYGPELATFTSYATDALAHRFWNERGPLLEAYRLSDEVLVELMARVTPETTIVVLSDHGFRAFDPSLDLPPFQPLTERLEARLGEAVPGLHVVRLGLKVSLSLEDPAQLPALEAALAALVDAEGAPVYRWEPVPDAPGAIGLTFVDERITAERLAVDSVGGEPLSDYARIVEAFAGEHDAAGVFLARGPAIPAGERLPDMQLLDVAPTLQALLGIAPAQDLEGRVMLGPSERGPASRDALIEAIRVGVGSEGVDEEMLRALGYIE
ncbi:MAG: alkaline phosphatase family protein [Alphaproteobacteria bacterium]|nr:alkaline phosphatase family protein [Alphaproteobacteria bacterium]MCB9797680.1 alkaline phosphatase family protein [Alphaproteobacteria bacterium]